MSKKGKVLHSGERNILLRLMTFFEEEKNNKKSITPIDILNIKAMKRDARKRRDARKKRITRQKRDASIKEPSQSESDTQSDTDEPSEVELKLLENERKYQSLLKSFDNVVKRTAAASGVSERTLRRIKLEAKNISSTLPEPGTSGVPISTVVRLSTPERKLPKKRLEIDDFMICSIRNIIEQYYSVNQVPTLRKILEHAKRDFNFPGQRGTLWKIITSKLGYKFKKCEKKSNSKTKNCDWESPIYMQDVDDEMVN